MAVGCVTPAREYAVDRTKVYHYLRQNYPERVLEWVKNEHWVDRDVPLSEIKMARRPGGREHDKVARIAEAVRRGNKMEPVILVQTADGYKIADGYHRTLAFQHAGKSRIPAIVATGVHDKGPWDEEMHAAKLNTGEREKEVRATPETMSLEQRVGFLEQTLLSVVRQQLSMSTPNPGGHRKPGYPEDPSKYADPQDKAYPLDTKEHVDAAARYFAKYKHKYDAQKRAEIERRIDEAEKKYKIGKYRDSAAVTSDAGDSIDMIRGVEEAMSIAKDALAAQDEDLAWFQDLIASQHNEKTDPEHLWADEAIGDFMRSLQGQWGRK